MVGTNGQHKVLHERGHSFPQVGFQRSSYEARIPEKCASDVIFSPCNFLNNSSI